MTELDPFNLDKHNPGADPTHWLIEVKDNLDNNQSIYIYCGKAGAASPNNGENTFPFFSDFLGSSLDTDKWIEYESDGTYTIADSILTLDSGLVYNKYEAIGAKTQHGPSRAFGMRVKCNENKTCFLLVSASDRSDGGGVEGGGIDSAAFEHWHRARNSSSIFSSIKREGVETWEGRDAGIENLFADYVYAEIRWTASAVKFAIEGVVCNTLESNVPADDMGFDFWTRPGQTGGGDPLAAWIEVDWAFVRKYVDPEPVVGTPEDIEPCVVVPEVTHRHHPTHPTEPNRGKVLSRMGSL